MIQVEFKERSGTTRALSISCSGHVMFKSTRNVWPIFRCHFSSYISTVGLEVHAQLLTSTKLFSPASTSKSPLPNTNVDPFDASIPGTLPVLNREAVRLAVRAGLALNCEISSVTSFVRKHYFYPDIPFGFQITQKDEPIASNGWIEYGVYDPYVHTQGYTKRSRVLRIQLEQDTGASLHDDTNNVTLVDLNRAGIALIEIVFDSDVTTGEEAAALVRDLVHLLRTNRVSSAQMSEGNIRVDANVSVRANLDDPLGVRTEIKNLNSIKSIARAINYEINRQSKLLEKGEQVHPETLTYDVSKQRTQLLRKKESDYDYRFLPDANLPCVRIRDSSDDLLRLNEDDRHAVLDVAYVKNEVVPTPSQVREEIMKKYQLTLENAIMILHEESKLKVLIDLMDDRATRDANLICDVLFSEIEDVAAAVKKSSCSLTLKNKHIGQVIDLLQGGKISRALAYDLLMMVSGENNSQYIDADLNELVDQFGWKFITGEEHLRPICLEVLSVNPKRAKGLLKNKKYDTNLMIDHVLQKTNRQANKAEIKRLLVKIARELHPISESKEESSESI